MPPFRALAIAAALMLLAGCSGAGDSDATPTLAPPPAPCVETTATPIAARPPALAETTSAWFGQGDVWVGLPDYPPAPQGDALVLRFPVVTLARGVPTSSRGAPVVSGTRTDAAGEAPGQIGGFSRAFGTDDLSFWPASVTFADAGCWSVTATLDTSAVSFTIAVERP